MSTFSDDDINNNRAQFTGTLRRMVEGQSFIATRAIVDDNTEQAMLEELLDSSKPPIERSNARGALHYLLYTPFRYPPLRHGGRFHRRFERSLFYASDSFATAAGEVAYYRFLFAADTTATFTPSYVDYTGFAVRIDTSDFLYLTTAPFDNFREKLRDPQSYRATQALGSQMRNTGILAFDFYSSRVEGINYGLFSAEVFTSNTPTQIANWKVYVTPERVEFTKQFDASPLIFDRTQFEKNGVLLRVS